MQQPNTALPSTETTPAPSGFVKVEGGGREEVSAEGTLVVAYLLIWAILVFFVTRILRGQREIRTIAERLLRPAASGSNTLSK